MAQMWFLMWLVEGSFLAFWIPAGREIDITKEAAPCVAMMILMWLSDSQLQQA